MDDMTVVDTYPLSPIQAGMLFHHLRGDQPGVDIEQMIGAMAEQLDADSMLRAWSEVCRRHDILRTAFRWEGLAEPMQDVAAEVSVELSVHDWTNLPITDARMHFDQFLVSDRLRGFDLAAAPLWRVAIARLGPDDERFVFTYHHSLLDFSVVWVAQEALSLYDAIRLGVEPPPIEQRWEFGNHIRWLGQHLLHDRAASQAYYADLLEGVEGRASLAALERSAAPVDHNGLYGAHRFLLDAELSTRLRAMAGEVGFPMAAIMEGVWAIVLGAFAGTDDVVFGSSRACRRSGLPGGDNVMGLFMNTPPVRLRMDPSGDLLTFIGDVRRQQRDKAAHEHTPLTDIQAAIADRTVAAFETVVVIVPRSQGALVAEAGTTSAQRTFELEDQTNFPLTMLIYLDPQIGCKLSYDLARFDEAAMMRVHELFAQVLQAIVDQPHITLDALPSVPASDIARLAAWNDTTRPYPADDTMHAQFEAQARQTPDAVALIDGERQLTYRQLDERGARVAARLRALGIGSDRMVGVHMDRSLEMMVGLLGILKAGGAYVPIDPTYPADRVAMMVEDANASVIITDAVLAQALPPSPAAVITIDDVASDGAPDGPLGPTDTPSSSLAYVIFTSGSTGRPKGVMVEHRNVVNFFTAMDEVITRSPDAAPSPGRPGVWLAVTSISFDISVLELFWTLTRGFTVVLQSESARLITGSVSTAPAPRSRPMDISLFYFAAAAGERGKERYRLLLEGAKFADRHGFTAVWTPERHFHEFGGLYPNPAVTSAAIAAVTDRIGIRAGSVVLPLHHPIRCAEDWSVVDNLSNGRVGLSFASGWHADDFALAPDHFDDRRAIMAEGIETIRALWRGESVPATSGDGRPISVSLHPQPVQHEPPMWITAGGSPETFAMAGRIGANILTNLLVMTEHDLVANIAAYRAARRAAGHIGDGTVSLMLHTFIGTDVDEVRATVRQPFLEYLRTSTDLINQVRWETTGFAKPQTQRGAPVEAATSLDELSDDEMAAIMDHAFDRYFRTAGLFGTVETCQATIERLQGLGVDEVACLIDFGVDEQVVLDGLVELDRLRQACATPTTTTTTTTTNTTTPTPAIAPITAATPDAAGIADNIRRHHVTHLQCTPSLAAVVAADDAGLSALGELQTLLVGGEALPTSLVRRVRPAIAGALINMYGPTETTIWSTASAITDAEAPIAIGHPIANNTVHIVDRHLRPVPVGAAGELLIGGAGVVRGYLHRSELTAERFVAMPGVGRVYRTGDLARWTRAGEIEFFGRLDHQVKIRGHRIELGEIETQLGRSREIGECVVVARPDDVGGQKLVAYVVPKASTDDATDRWTEVWDETYAASTSADATLDLAGWTESFTGQPIPVAEMIEWVENTVSRIAALAPRRVLEIGCGTGMLLFRVAPMCDRYVGIDTSAAAVDLLRHRLDVRADFTGRVHLIHGEAQHAATLVDERFDTVVINSVAQYFGSIDTFIDVIAQAHSVLEPGGRLFLGDLRNKDLAVPFATAVELSRATDDVTLAELQTRIANRVATEEELLIDPRLFGALSRSMPDLGAVELLVKTSGFDNELSRYRYDVVLTKSPIYTIASNEVIAIDGDPFSGDAVGVALESGPCALVVRGVRNARLAEDEFLASELFPGTPVAGTVGDVRRATPPEIGDMHPSEIGDLHPEYHAAAVWTVPANPFTFDVLLRRRGDTRPLDLVDTSQILPWSFYANEPGQRISSTLVPDLRQFLGDLLPTYMIPSAFVVLQALPRTPNGKIDRASLPDPARSRQETAEVVTPDSDTERTIAAVWQDMLSLDSVSVETNVFDLGANSLMMVKANTRLRNALAREVTLVDMFNYPTVRSLAEFLDGDGSAGGAVLADSVDRANLRTNAIQRRRQARQSSRRSS